jgi:hypothetical protein
MEAPTISQLRSGPPTVSLLTAAAAIGIGRTKAYELAKRDEFPVAVRRVGATYRVPVAESLSQLWAGDFLPRSDRSLGHVKPHSGHHAVPAHAVRQPSPCRTALPARSKRAGSAARGTGLRPVAPRQRRAGMKPPTSPGSRRRAQRWRVQPGPRHEREACRRRPIRGSRDRPLPLGPCPHSAPQMTLRACRLVRKIRLSWHFKGGPEGI